MAKQKPTDADDASVGFLHFSENHLEIWTGC